MAEGAGALVLESLESAQARGAKILGVMEGCGEMADAFHRTRSSPDGKPIIGCIRNALADAGLSPDDIDYVNPHGTGTPENDKMEAMGVMAVFGERAKTLPMSSNKSMIGHTLSAAGAVEAVFSLLTLAAPAHPADHQLQGARPGDSARRGAERGARRQGAPRHLQFVRLRRPERLAGDGARAGVTATIRALELVADRKLELNERPAPPPPAAGEVQIAVKAVALNHIDVWGFRGMAFAKRKLPLVVGAEAAGEIAAVGDGVTGFKPGDPVVMYGALTCGACKACREGRDNLCENVAGIMGFHVDGFARDRINMPARLVIPVPKGVAMRDAACAPIAFSTVEHMLFDNAKLQPGETILVQAGGSGIGTAAIKMAKAIGCTVITTVGDDDKAAKAKALGADHVINYRTRAVRDDHAQAHQQEGRRRGVRACRRRRLQRLAAGAQARRPAGHLRLDRGAEHHLQPDAAVPAAVQDLRLVRRLDAQHPRQPRQDGGRAHCR